MKENNLFERLFFIQINIYFPQRYFVWIKQMLFDSNKFFVWIKKSLSNKLFSFIQLNLFSEFSLNWVKFLNLKVNEKFRSWKWIRFF